MNTNDVILLFFFVVVAAYLLLWVFRRMAKAIKNVGKYVNKSKKTKFD